MGDDVALVDGIHVAADPHGAQAIQPALAASIRPPEEEDSGVLNHHRVGNDLLEARVLLDGSALGEEPDHVCFENIAVLENEEFGIHDFISILDGIDVADFESTDTLVEHLRERFRQKVGAAGLAPAVFAAAERRIDRVNAYLTLGEGAGSG